MTRRPPLTRIPLRRMTVGRKGRWAALLVGSMAVASHSPLAWSAEHKGGTGATTTRQTQSAPTHKKRHTPRRGTQPLAGTADTPPSPAGPPRVPRGGIQDGGRKVGDRGEWFGPLWSGLFVFECVALGVVEGEIGAGKDRGREGVFGGGGKGEEGEGGGSGG